MEIFCANKNKIDPRFLTPFENKDFKLKKRRAEFALSRFILDFALKNFYKIKNYEIEIKNKKPVLKDNKLHFSISHSNDYAIIGFNNFPIGVDIELIKDRDFEKLSGYFGKNIKEKDEFYKFWTQFEAKYKLQAQGKFFRSFKFMKSYMVSISSENEFEPITIYEIEDNLCIKKSEL